MILMSLLSPLSFNLRKKRRPNDGLALWPGWWCPINPALPSWTWSGCSSAPSGICNFGCARSSPCVCVCACVCVSKTKFIRVANFYCWYTLKKHAKFYNLVKTSPMKESFLFYFFFKEEGLAGS